MSQVKILQNTGGYQIRSDKPLAGFNIEYSHFNPGNLGFSVGLQLTGKQYLIYEERRLPTARLQSSTRPRYYTYSLPLAFECRGNPFLADAMSPDRRGFYSLSAGLALAYTQEISIRVRYRARVLISRAASGTPMTFPSLPRGYEIFLKPAYNFWFRDWSYLGLEFSFTV